MSMVCELPPPYDHHHHQPPPYAQDEKLALAIATQEMEASKLEQKTPLPDAEAVGGAGDASSDNTPKEDDAPVSPVRSRVNDWEQFEEQSRNETPQQQQDQRQVTTPKSSTPSKPGSNGQS